MDWGIDVPVEGAEGKNYTFGLMRQLVTFRQPKNGRLVKEKDWEPYWKDADTKLVHFIGKDNIVFPLHHFPSNVKSGRKLYFT